MKKYLFQIIRSIKGYSIFLNANDSGKIAGGFIALFSEILLNIFFFHILIAECWYNGFNTISFYMLFQNLVAPEKKSTDIHCMSYNCHICRVLELWYADKKFVTSGACVKSSALGWNFTHMC